MTSNLTWHQEAPRDARERAIADEVERRAAYLTPILLMILYANPAAENRD